MTQQRLQTRAWMVLSSLVLFAGCGGGLPDDAPETVPVYGTVTMDGQPLADATVSFAAANPADRLRTVSGVTDSDGEYELAYSLSQSGAAPGTYIVSISTYRRGGHGEGLELRPETVPENYNTRTTLTAEVTPDDSEFNFELDSSSGEVVQPAMDN